MNQLVNQKKIIHEVINAMRQYPSFGVNFNMSRYPPEEAPKRQPIQQLLHPPLGIAEIKNPRKYVSTQTQVRLARNLD